jgi:hypothetical protein
MRFAQQGLDARAQGDAPPAQVDVMPSLGGMQFADAGIGIGQLKEFGRMARAEEADALLAAGHLQQFAIQGLVPVPGQARPGKGGIEGGTMAVALGIGQRAIDVEDQGLQHGDRIAVRYP